MNFAAIGFTFTCTSDGILTLIECKALTESFTDANDQHHGRSLVVAISRSGGNIVILMTMTIGLVSLEKSTRNLIGNRQLRIDLHLCLKMSGRVFS